MARAVLEGVAFGLRDSLDLVRPLAGSLSTARVSGGGARSDLWLKILASVLELPLELPQVEEGAAYGAALLGGVAGGVWATAHEAVSACVSVRRTIDPDPRWIKAYAGAARALSGRVSRRARLVGLSLSPARRPAGCGRGEKFRATRRHRCAHAPRR